MPRKRPRLNRPTVARPWVDLPDWVRRVDKHIDDNEVNVVCQDTGLVVYTTPSYAWGGQHSRVAAAHRMIKWLARHGFKYNAADHGYYTRTTDSVIVDPSAVVAAFKEVLPC